MKSNNEISLRYANKKPFRRQIKIRQAFIMENDYIVSPTQMK